MEAEGARVGIHVLCVCIYIYTHIIYIYMYIIYIYCETSILAPSAENMNERCRSYSIQAASVLPPMQADGSTYP